MPRIATVIRTQVRRALFRSRAWRRLFQNTKTGEALSDDGRIALAHIKRFARWGKPPVGTDRTGRSDPFEVGRMVGRQEVVQLIIEALNLDERTLVNLQEDIPDE
jgi:hypothetical protein